MSGLIPGPWPFPRLSALALCLLAACAPAAPPASGSYRDSRTPIYSIAAFDPQRLPGRWIQAAAFGPETENCRPGGLQVDRTAVGLTAAMRLCLSGAQVARSGALTPTGPGRLALAGEAEPWWVIWVDTDYRTLVIGTPSGRFGFILNRGGELPPDRLRAAREILEWNGYDLSRLRVYR